jgi:flagellar hook-associated protein 2
VATLSSPGLGSGLDVAALVAQLVAAERAPAELRIQRAESAADTKISALGALNGVLSGLQTALTGLKTESAFQARTANSADKTVFTATSTSSAPAGQYNVQVSALAKAQRLNSTPFVAGSTTVLGTGTLTLSMGAKSFAVDIDSTNNTLAGIRDAINASTDNAGTIKATIIQAADGARLVLSASKTGAANAMKVRTTGGDGGLSPLVYDPGVTTNLVELNAAQDASVVVEGFTVTSATNTIEGAIEGVTLNLLAAKPGTDVVLTVSKDLAATRDKVKKFVTEYNNVAAKVIELRKYDPTTKTAGALLGDALLRGIESGLRRELSTASKAATVPYDTLAAIGVTTGADGKLKVDDTKLNAALDADFDSVGKLFGATDGVAARIGTLVDEALKSDGTLSTRTKGLAASKVTLSKDRDALDARMAVVEARYKAQFIAMDSYLSQMQSTGTYLARQLAATNTNNN